MSTVILIVTTIRLKYKIKVRVTINMVKIKQNQNFELFKTETFNNKNLTNNYRKQVRLQQKPQLSRFFSARRSKPSRTPNVSEKHSAPSMNEPNPPADMSRAAKLLIHINT